MVPLSVDALDYDFSNPFNKNNDEILKVENKNEPVSDAESVASAEDLINFSDEESTTTNLVEFNGIESSSLANKKKLKQPQDSIDKFNEFISEFLPNSLTIQQSLQSKSNDPVSQSSSLTQKQTNLETSVFQQPKSQFKQSNVGQNFSASIQRKKNWETFE